MFKRNLSFIKSSIISSSFIVLYNKRLCHCDIHNNASVNASVNDSVNEKYLYKQRIISIKKDCESIHSLPTFRSLYNVYGWAPHRTISRNIDEKGSFKTFNEWAEALKQNDSLAIELDQEEVILRTMVFKMIDVIMHSDDSIEELNKICDFIEFEELFYLCLSMDRARIINTSFIFGGNGIWASIEDCMKNPEMCFATIDPRYMYVIQNNKRFMKNYGHLVM